MVNDWLDEELFLDDIVAKLALQNPPIHVHRSSVHRHKQHSLRERAHSRREREAEARMECSARILVEWGNESFFGALAGQVTCDGIVPASQASQSPRETVWISVSFETLQARNPPGPLSFSRLSAFPSFSLFLSLESYPLGYS